MSLELQDSDFDPHLVLEFAEDAEIEAKVKASLEKAHARLDACEAALRSVV